ncbi:TetR/AcrR family transcriptional regulator [Oceanibacterium hippocampi]|uniref:HTH-type transcriptional repressor KstR2 n=1 Tax=Oceanibacterium hippocampi TaxID=745714 RepID=A0A1Y5S462_9PROT|nr:TetR/AcrR family transcriptional regulator [Oceanibacterium hippocampi]SLN32240.1 HTH-type transcriptional repressor KstR2 [Oceanibacterium hippocampi]
MPNNRLADMKQATGTAEASAARRGGGRREEIMAVAARLFSSKGYSDASMRDIAREVGMLPGSLYYHFPSKEALFAAAHGASVAAIRERAEQAVAEVEEPWARLEAASAAHLEALLQQAAEARIVIIDFSTFPEKLRRELVRQRDAYEALFEALIDDLDLPTEQDRRLLRLGLLGSLNWVPKWYRPGGLSPAGIARAFVRQLRP